MKINCDMGESFGSWVKGNDAEVMPYIDMANIACGFHASDPSTMDETVRCAVDNQVKIGAHPGYPDLIGFGRREMNVSAQDLEAMLIYQVGALESFCRKYQTTVSYIKPHGAMYNQMMKDEAMLKTIMRAVATLSPQYPLVVMATPRNDVVREFAEQTGINVWFEAFSDRSYDDEGFLVPRSVQGAVHNSLELVTDQVTQIIMESSVTSISGKTLKIDADTICIHGDGDHALSIAKAAMQCKGLQNEN
ncbi:5-oxoprolinase subunit PxpA [Vibrio caribbeanicus]|uniref:LamB/YcsF family protein n=1 Tax=Vibrio caribbeanicus ATCC BAA-2122 TaxID=796620 RepID=E3BHH9_9VIBR|nr:5-oxoprolinase subunit PxpA [Vibrio caribbeanicus]EFP97510.1 LamB/YcsF family protein [Vibrio caribbeanicus ATCC BAA-2122]